MEKKQLKTIAIGGNIQRSDNIKNKALNNGHQMGRVSAKDLGPSENQAMDQ